MNESFSSKRFFALIKPVSWKQLLIGGALSVLILSVMYSILINTSEFTYAVVFFGLMHQMQFKFMSSQSGLSGFLLLPATIEEKYLALFTKVIVFPTIFILTIALCINFITKYLPSYSANSVFQVDGFYISILLFVILFCLRFVLRWNSFGVYFILYIVLMIPLLLLNKYIHDGYHTLANYPIYNSLFYILLSAVLLSFTYPQMKKLEMNRIKEKVDKL